eukprot:scaffold2292_cov301-Pavlova_lutheri.AAC.12
MGLDRDADDMPEVGELEMDLVLRMVDLTEALQEAQVESAAKDAALTEARKSTEVLAQEVTALDSRYQVLVASLEGQRDRAIAKSVLLEDEVRLMKQEQSTALLKEREEMGERIAELEKSSKEASDLAASLQESLPPLTTELHDLKIEKEEALKKNAELAELVQEKDVRIEELFATAEAMTAQLKNIDRALRGLSAALGITEASISSMGSDEVLHQLKGEVDALRGRISALEDEKSKLQDTVASLEAADNGMSSALQSEMNSLQAAFSEESGKRTVIEKELSEEKERSASVETQLSSAMMESESLKEEAEALKIQCQTLQQNVDELAHVVSDRDILLKGKDELVTELERKLKLKEGSSTEQVKHLQQELQEREAYLDDVLVELKNKDKTINEISAASSELQSSIQDLQTKVSNAEEQLGGKDGEISEVKANLEEMKNSNSLLQSQVVELQSTVAKLEDQLRETKSVLDTSEAKNADLVSKVEELTEACRSSGSEVGDLKSQLQSANEEIATLKRDHSAKESKLLDELAQREEHAKAFDAISAAKDALEAEKFDASQRVKVAEEEIASLKSQVEKLEEDKTQLEEKLEDRESSANGLLATKQDMEEKLIALSQEHSEKISTFEKQIEELTCSLNEEKSRAASLEQEANATKQSLEELERTNQALESIAAEAEKKLSSGTEQVALTEKVASEQIAALEEKLELALLEAQRLRESLQRKNEILGMSKKFLGDILEGKDADAVLEVDGLSDQPSNGSTKE